MVLHYNFFYNRAELGIISDFSGQDRVLVPCLALRFSQKIDSHYFAVSRP